MTEALQMLAAPGDSGAKPYLDRILWPVQAQLPKVAFSSPPGAS